MAKIKNTKNKYAYRYTLDLVITIKLTKPERVICVEPREYPSFNLSQNISSSANRPPQIKKISGKFISTIPDATKIGRKDFSSSP